MNKYISTLFSKSPKNLLISIHIKNTLSSDTKSNTIRDRLFAPMQKENDKKPRKVSVIGASGNVGQIVSYQMMLKQMCDELVLYDTTSTKVCGVGMDLSDGASIVNYPKIVVEPSVKGEKTKDSDLLIVCSGIGPNIGQDRLEALKDNANLLKVIIPPLAKLSPNAKIIVVSNPVDLMAYAAWKYSGFPFHRVIGVGTTLDSTRLRIMIGKKLGISPQCINAWVIGEHGLSSVLCWSSINVAGTRLKECKKVFGLKEDLENWFDLEGLTIDQGMLVQKLRGFTNNGVAMCAAELAEAILMDTRQIHPVSTNCDGYYGLKIRPFLSLPAVIGNQGVHQLVKLKITPDELEKFKKSVATLDKAMASYPWDEKEHKKDKKKEQKKEQKKDQKKKQRQVTIRLL